MKTNERLTKAELQDKAEAYCSRQEHCRSEVAAKLAAWGAEAGEADDILSALEGDGFIDDARYSRFYIHDKYLYDKWGWHKIAQALSLKRIPSSVYAPLMDEVIDRDEYLEILSRLLAAKRRTVKAADNYTLRQKLLRFALQRGYSIDDASQCLDTIL